MYAVHDLLDLLSYGEAYNARRHLSLCIQERHSGILHDLGALFLLIGPLYKY